MDVRQLEYFLAVVDHGGFHRAARQLLVSQPALSQAIRGLERELGVAVFDRIGRRAVLNAAGRRLVEPAREAVRGLAAVREAAASVSGTRTGQVRVISTSSPAMSPLSGIVAMLQGRHPAISVTIDTAMSAADVVDAVREGRSEFGLAGIEEPTALSDVEYHHLVDAGLRVIAPSGSILAGRARIRCAELSGVPFIAAQRGTRMRALAEELIAEGVDLRIVAETGHRGGLVALVISGVGYAFVSEGWGETARRFGADVAKIDRADRLPIWLVFRRGPLTGAAEAFRQAAIDDAASRGDGIDFSPYPLPSAP